jgi:hypothetical protein
MLWVWRTGWSLYHFRHTGFKEQPRGEIQKAARDAQLETGGSEMEKHF